MKKLKPIPRFKNEDQEAAFWNSHDTTEYIDWTKAVQIDFPNLKPSTETISLRLPLSLLNQIKILAHKKDVPYQSLMKMYLNQSAERELRQSLKK